MKFLDLNGVSILWQRIKTIFARKNETVSNISRNNTTFTATRADGTTFTFDQKDTTYNDATTTTAGLMSATDKTKLNSIENGAQENVVESVSVNGTKQAVTNKGINITVPTAVSSLNNDVGYLTEESDPTVPTWAKQPQKPAYTASEVGALPANTHIPTDVSELNNDVGYLTEHQDISGIEDAIAGLTTKLNTLADSDDTTLDQLSEIVAYIKNNKSLINGITTGKVSVDDIVDNLTSTAANKPLSAKQGKALKDMIDGIVVPTNVSELNNDANYVDNQYVDDAIATALADISGIKYHVCATDEYDHLTFLPTVEGEAGTIYLVPKPLSEAGKAIVGKSVTKSELSKSNSAFAGYSIVRSQENSTDSTQNDNNYYYEYIYNNSAFELIGDTQVSLDGYLKNNDIATMSDVEQMLIKIGLDE